MGRKELETKAMQLSGALTDPAGRLYSSFHYPEFSLLQASRNTLDRFTQFDVPEDLKGKTVLDLGSNTGAVSFEFARRGAKVVGLECNAERVAFCNELAAFLKVPAKFHHVDLDSGLPETLDRKYDIVSCMSVDAYVKDRAALYDLVARCTGDTCYFESNYPNSVSRDLQEEIKDIRNHFKRRFSYVNYVGQSSPNGRRVFVMSRRYFFMPREKGYIEGGWHWKRFSSYDDWAGVRDVLNAVRLPYMPEFDLDEPYVIRTCVFPDAKSHSQIRKSRHLYRQQIIDFVVGLNQCGYAHRDLHLDNLLFVGDQIYVIDWEWATKNRVPLCESYDLTGKGLDLPGVSPRIGAQTIFFGFRKLPSIAKFFGITLADFECFDPKVSP